MKRSNVAPQAPQSPRSIRIARRVSAELTPAERACIALRARRRRAKRALAGVPKAPKVGKITFKKVPPIGPAPRPVWRGAQPEGGLNPGDMQRIDALLREAAAQEVAAAQQQAARRIAQFPENALFDDLGPHAEGPR